MSRRTQSGRQQGNQQRNQGQRNQVQHRNDGSGQPHGRRDFRNREDQYRGGRGSDEQAWNRDGGRQSNYGGASQLNAFEQQYEGERGDHDQHNLGHASQDGDRDEQNFGRTGDGTYGSYRRGYQSSQQDGRYEDGPYEGGFEGRQYRGGFQGSQAPGDEYSRGYRREERYPSQQEGVFQQDGAQYRRGIDFESYEPVSYGQTRRPSDVRGAQGFGDSTDLTGYGMGEYRPGGSEGSSGRSFAGRGPRGYRRQDERITEDINERLTQDHWIDAEDIDVRVSEGEVTLEGTVQDRQAKRLAEDLVERLSGVRNVINHLRVKSASGSDSPSSSRSGNESGPNETGRVTPTSTSSKGRAS